MSNELLLKYKSIVRNYAILFLFFTEPTVQKKNDS